MTTYEIRRGAAVVTAKPDAETALSFAALHSHFPGQLKVWEVTHSEQLISQPSQVIPIRGAGGLRAGGRGR